MPEARLQRTREAYQSPMFTAEQQATIERVLHGLLVPFEKDGHTWTGYTCPTCGPLNETNTFVACWRQHEQQKPLDGRPDKKLPARRLSGLDTLIAWFKRQAGRF